MTDKLTEICTRTREYVAAQKKSKPLSVLEQEMAAQPAARGFAAALARKAAAVGFGIIAEIKKASPSAGILRPDFDPAGLAEAYTTGGAACLSVLTDEPYFQGRNTDLIAARHATSLPVLRKDFMIDPWQVAETRAIGGDCILIIMAAVSDALAADLFSAAMMYGLDVLIETHDEYELERALKLPAGLIGINNRNLKTLKTDLATTAALAHRVPGNRFLVSESGIENGEDIGRLRACGARAFLVGESLLRAGDVAGALGNLVAAA